MGFRLLRPGLLAGGLLLLGCYSPTLPLPPPGEPEVTSVAGTDRFRLVGEVEPEAEVLSLNQHTRVIAGQSTRSDGHYDFEVVGEEGDQIKLWYIAGDDPSPSITFLLPAPEPAPAE